MRGIVKKEEESLIVVYHRECVEDSDAVIRVSCKLMPGFHMLFKDGDNIEFELIEFAQEDGSFNSYARPYLKANPHITNIMDNIKQIYKVYFISSCPNLFFFEKFLEILSFFFIILSLISFNLLVVIIISLLRLTLLLSIFVFWM